MAVSFECSLREVRSGAGGNLPEASTPEWAELLGSFVGRENCVYPHLCWPSYLEKEWQWGWLVTAGVSRHFHPLGAGS